MNIAFSPNEYKKDCYNTSILVSDITIKKLYFKKFFEVLAPLCIRVEIIRPVHACRDPNDDKFLEVAINGSAYENKSFTQSDTILYNEAHLSPNLAGGFLANFTSPCLFL